MKKVFSLILAVAMVLSLASVAFAAVDKFDYLTYKVKDVGCYGYDNQWYTLSSGKLTPATSYVFGKTYYMPIIANTTATSATQPFTATDGVSETGTDAAYRTVRYATFAKQVGTLNPTINLTEGSKFVDSVTIKPIFVITDCDGATPINRNIYAIALTTKGEATKKQSVVGEIVVAGKSGSGSVATKVEEKIPVDFQIYYDTESVKTGATGVTELGGELSLLRTGDKKFANCEYTPGATDITEVSFNNDDIKATVENSLEGKYLVTFNTIDDEAVLAANPDAVVMCYNITFNFRQNAEIEVKPIDEEGSNYLYQKLPSGALKDLTSTYVEDDGLFEFTARKLAGTYYVSDMPLVF